jgi:hypothetical protein
MTTRKSIDGDATNQAKTAAAPSLNATAQPDSEAWCREHKQRWDRIYKELLRDAQACVRAMSLSPKLNGPEEWKETVAKSAQDYRSGRALMDQLGATDGLLDPPTAAMLLTIRRGLIEETQAQTVSEMALIDLAVIAFANAMRIQTVITNMALVIEREMFGQQSLRAKWKSEHGEYEKIQGLYVEDYIGRLRDRLMPLVEKFHHLARNHIEAIGRLRQTPAVHVERAKAINLVVVAPKRH